MRLQELEDRGERDKQRVLVCPGGGTVMRTMFFTQAVDDALAQAMAEDPRIVLFGEDVPLLRRNLLVRFGPGRVRGTPISESAFLGAGVAAAMAGLRPVVEMYMVDFLEFAWMLCSIRPPSRSVFRRQ
jgi:hypothetical protein